MSGSWAMICPSMEDLNFRLFQAKIQIPSQLSGIFQTLNLFPLSI
jgi:hypothetical protein